MTSAKKLNPKQQRFVDEYLVDLNATQAAIRAGYSKKTAASVGAENLRKPQVAAAITAAQAARSERTHITQDDVLRELARIGLSDLRQAFDVDGKLLLPKHWPDDFARAVSSVEVVTKNLGEGMVEYVAKLRMWDKNSALEKVAKHLGMLRERMSLENPDGTPIQGAVIYLPANGRETQPPK